MPLHPRAPKIIDWEAPPPFSVSPFLDPVHHHTITAIAADRDAFTADGVGRILRWRRTQDGGVEATVVRAQSDGPIHLLATAGERVAWIEDGRPSKLYVAPLDRPEDAVRVASSPRDGWVRAMRMSSEGSRLWLAVPAFGSLCERAVDRLEIFEGAGDESAVPPTDLTIESAGWSARLVEVAKADDKFGLPRATFARDGRLLVRAGKPAEGHLSLPSAGIDRSTRVLVHGFSHDRARLVAFDVLRDRAVLVPLAQDRATLLGAIPAARPVDRQLVSVDDAASSPSEARFAALVADPGAGRRLLVADAKQGWATQIDVPWSGTGRLAFWGEDRLLFSTRDGLRQVRVGPTLEVEAVPSHGEEVRVDATLLRGEVHAWTLTRTHLFLLLRSGALCRFDFARGVIEGLGEVPELGDHPCTIHVLGDARGEVLIVCTTSKGGWRAYDLSNGKELWRRAAPGSPLFHHGVAAYGDRLTPRLIDLRTGEDGDVTSLPTAPKGWSMLQDKVFDGAGRVRVQRALVVGDQEAEIDPGGRWLFVQHLSQARVARLQDLDPPIDVFPDEPNEHCGLEQMDEAEAPLADDERGRPSWPALSRSVRVPAPDPASVPVLALPPPDAPEHHAALVALAGGARWAFSVDRVGRILRWGRGDNGEVVASVWRFGHGPDAGLRVVMAVDGDWVAWAEQSLAGSDQRARVFVGRAEDPDSAEEVGTVPRPVHALRVDDDGGRIVVACDPAFELDHEAPKDWERPRERICSVVFTRGDAAGGCMPAGLAVAPKDPWRVSFGHLDGRSFLTKASHVRLGPGGEILTFGARHERNPKNEIAWTGFDRRVTKLIGHELGPEGDQLVAVSPSVGKVMTTGGISDRAKWSAVLSGPKVDAKAELVWASAASASGRRYAVLFRANYGPAQLVLADLEESARLEAPSVGFLSAPRLAFLGEDVLLMAADVGQIGTWEIATGAWVARTGAVLPGVPPAATRIDAVAVSHAVSEHHVWVLTREREILAIDFDSGQVDGFGRAPTLSVDEDRRVSWIGYVRHDKGDVLVLWGARDWLGYDVDRGECLWHRAFDGVGGHGRLRPAYDQLGEEVSSGHVALIDPRTGEPLERIAPESGAAPGRWRAVAEHDVRSVVVFDAAGRSRARLDPEVFNVTGARWVQDPGGSSAAVLGKDGVSFVRLAWEPGG